MKQTSLKKDGAYPLIKAWKARSDVDVVENLRKMVLEDRSARGFGE